MKFRVALIGIVFLLLGLTVLAVPAASHGQTPPREQLEAMSLLQHWVGLWQGSGWAATGPRERQEFQITETVSGKLGGSVLLLEGLGTTMTESGDEIVTHNAIGLVSFDPAGGRYNLRSHDLRGSVHDSTLEIDGDVMRWAFRDESSGAQLRFEIRVEGDTWHEIGHVSPDGNENWYPMLEMTLHRQDATNEVN
ncbi:MAG: hypothetical protein WD397_02420 [Wenzhouxiangellaceae bacterium]